MRQRIPISHAWVHTESSYKSNVERFGALADAAGWRADDVWLDAAGRFSVHVLAAPGRGP